MNAYASEHRRAPDSPDAGAVALYTMGGGIVGALLAAVPGLVDLLSLPPGPRRTALAHMAINLTVVVLNADDQQQVAFAHQPDEAAPFFRELRQAVGLYRLS